MKKRISKRRAQSKRQKKARKEQRKILQSRKPSRNPPLTPEQKKLKQERAKKAKALKAEKRERKKTGKETTEANTIKKAISSIFTPELLDGLAKSTKFIQRKGGELQAFAYMYIMSFGFFGNGKISLEGLTSLLSSSFDIEITSQALSKRINTKKSVDFLSRVFKKLLNIQLITNLESNATARVFSNFTSVNLQDSSQISLNPLLAKDFAGCGRSGSKSAIKIDFIFDILNVAIRHVKLVKGTTSDLALAKDMVKYVKAKSLAIRDLGYFEIATLRNIQSRLGYYISRLSIGTNVYLGESDKTKLDIIQFLKNTIYAGVTSVNQIVYIGAKERFKTLLVVEKVSENVSKQRRERYKKENGKAPTEYYTEWCGYAIFITNIPNEQISPKMVIAIYKIRWQIELIFKNLKSNLEIDYLLGTNKYRIESVVYGRLITMSTLLIIQNYAGYIAEEQQEITLASQGKEVSEDKLTKWLKVNARLCVAIIKNSLLQMLVFLELEIAKVCKKRRKRQTTLEHIQEIFDEEHLKACG